MIPLSVYMRGTRHEARGSRFEVRGVLSVLYNDWSGMWKWTVVKKCVLELLDVGG